MGLVQHPPLLRRQVQRVLQAPKDQEARIGSVAVKAQGGQGQRMGGVVGEVETALEAQLTARRIVEAPSTGTDQAQNLALGGRLGLQLADASQVIELRMARPSLAIKTTCSPASIRARKALPSAFLAAYSGDV